eukprot:GHVP01033045.1.p1 GENE.GHVP01033045.1~~GHVP01033045.1.p1  ORF type:complete len:105 (-),score=5.23 GHVP01033045.1:336-650(-)
MDQTSLCPNNMFTLCSTKSILRFETETDVYSRKDMCLLAVIFYEVHFVNDPDRVTIMVPLVVNLIKKVLVKGQTKPKAHHHASRVLVIMEISYYPNFYRSRHKI